MTFDRLVIYSVIAEQLGKLYKQHIGTTSLSYGLTETEAATMIEQAADFLVDDLLAYVEVDPAARGSLELVRTTYMTFEALVAHRLAHQLHQKAKLETEYLGTESPLIGLARSITEAAKRTTTIDLHPNARLGRRFVLDHGQGTVIGETCRIGDNCTILNNVVLGASGVARNVDNEDGFRHPQIGNRVQIAGNVNVLGPVIIGDDCRIGAKAQITTDLAPNSRVSIAVILQIERPPITVDRKPLVFGLMPRGPGRFRIEGENLVPCKVEWPAGGSPTFDVVVEQQRAGTCDRVVIRVDRLSPPALTRERDRDFRIRLLFGEDDNGRLEVSGLVVTRAFLTARQRRAR